MIAARTSATLQAKRRRGERVGQVPFGYRLENDGVYLVADEAEQRTLGRIRAMREQGATIKRIAAALNHAKTPSRDRRWHATTVQRLLARID